MGFSEHKDNFDLQPLEQRIMLSADPVVGVVPGCVPDDLDGIWEIVPESPPVEEVISYDDPSDRNQSFQEVSYDPSENIEDLFSGLDEQDPFFSPEEESVAQSALDLENQESELKALELCGTVLVEVESGAVLFFAFSEGSGGLGVLGPYEVPDTRLQTSVYEYFNDGLDPPDYQVFLRTIEEYLECADKDQVLPGFFEQGGENPSGGVCFEGCPGDLHVIGLGDSEIFIENGQLRFGDQLISYSNTENIHIGFLGDTGAIFVKSPLEFTGEVYLAAAEIRVDAPIDAGDISLVAEELSISQRVYSEGGTIMLTAGSIDLQGQISSPGGQLVLQPESPDTTIGVGDGVDGDFYLGAEALDLIEDGFDSIVIGRTDGSHEIQIGSYVFKDSVTVNSPVLGGGIHVRGALQTSDPEARITFNGSYSTTVLDEDVNTVGGDYTVNDNLEIADGKTITISTKGGDINFNDVVNGQSGAGEERLILDAGTGTITFNGNVGNSIPLKEITIRSAGEVIFNGFVVVDGALVQETGSGSTRFRGDVTVDSLDIRSTNSITFGQAGSTINVTTDPTNPGSIILQVDKDASPGLIDFHGPVTSHVDLIIREAKDVSFEGGTVSINGSFSQTTGSGQTIFGGTVAVGALDIRAENLIQFNGIFTVDTAGDVTLVSDEINFSDTPDSVIGSGVLTMQPSTSAVAVLRPDGDDNNIVFLAKNTGTAAGSALNGETIQLTHTGTLQPTYSSGILNINVNDGITTAQEIVDAVNAILDPDSMPFTARLESGEAGTGTVDSTTTASVQTFGGEDLVTVDIGSLSVGTGTRLEINATDLAALKNGFSSIIIGGFGQNEGPVQIGAVTGNSAFNEPVTIFGTEITVSDQVDGDTKISLTARTGNTTILDGASLNVAQTGSDIQITSQQHIYINDGGSLSADDEITLTASTGTIGPQPTFDPGLVSAATLIANAETGIDLKTTVSSLEAHVNGTGPIEVDETDAITLTDIDTADGSIEITAGDTITAQDVASLTDDQLDPITLTAESGNILVGLISTTGGAFGDVSLTAQSGAITDNSGGESANLIADVAMLSAVSGIGASDAGDLDVDINILDASNSGVSGDIVITQSGGALEIQQLEQSDPFGAGLVTVQVSADNLTLSTNGATVAGSGSVDLQTLAGDILLNAAINAVSGKVTVLSSGAIYQNANADVTTTSGQVYFEAQGSSILVVDGITVTTGSGHILYKSSTAIQFGNDTGSDPAIQSTNGGSITLLASGGDVDQKGNLQAAAGTIDVEATSGSVTMDDGVSSVTVGQNIRYFAAVNLFLSLLDTRNGSILNQDNWGQVLLEASAGAIADAAGDTDVDIYAAAVRFEADVELGTSANFIETEVAAVAAQVAGGGINLVDSTAVTVGAIGSVPVIRVLDSGTEPNEDTDPLTLTGLETGVGSNGRIVLVTLDGAIEVLEAVLADGSGNILLHAQGGEGANVVLENRVESGIGHVSVMAADVGNAFVFFRPLGEHNDMLLRARSGGEALSGVTVRFTDDGTLAGDEASVEFNAFTRTLTINIRNGLTTSNSVISAIDAEGSFDAFRDTRLETDNDGTGTIHTPDSVPAAGGDATNKATVQVLPLGDNNDLTFTAAVAGSSFNGAVVHFIDDGTIEDDSAEALYSIINKILTINIHNGVTTAGAVIEAVIAEGTFTASLNKAIETLNDGSGVLHTVPAVTVFHHAVSQTAEGDIRVPGGTGTVIVEAQNGSIFMAEGAVTETLGTNIRYSAADDVVLGVFDTRDGFTQTDWGSISILASNGSVMDTDPEGDSSVDIYANAVRFTSTTGVGEIGLPGNPIETEVLTVAAAATSGSISLIDSSDITVTAIGTVPASGVQADGSAPVVVQDGDALSDLDAAGDGSIILRTVGLITLNDGSDLDGQAVKAEGTGSVLLETQGPGNSIAINADVISGSGMLGVASAGDVTMAPGTQLQSDGQAIGIQAAGAVALDLVDARTADDRDGDLLDEQASWGWVGLTALDGGITDVSVPDSDVNIYAGDVRLTAKAKIGELLAYDDTVEDPIELEVLTVTANTATAAAGDSGTIHLVESSGVTVGAVDSQSDLVSGSTGPIVLRTLNAGITIEDGDNTDGIGIISVGAGNVVIEAPAGVEVNADVISGLGTLTVSSAGGAIAMTEGTTLQSDGQAIDIQASGDVVLALVDARTAADQSFWGVVSVTTTDGGITDASVDDTDVDIYASSVRFSAKTRVGELAEDGGLNPLEIETAILTAQTTSLEGADSGSISLVGATGVTVGTVGSQSDLTSASDGSIVLRTLNGGITVTDGAFGAGQGVMAHGAGNILLENQGTGNITINAAVSSGSGHISVLSYGDVIQQTAGHIQNTGAGSLDIRAQGNLTMLTPGLIIGTGGGNIRLYARDNISFTGVDAVDGASGAVGMTAENGSITAGGAAVDIEAEQLRLTAAYGVGTPTNSIGIGVGVVTAFAGAGGIHLVEGDDVTVGPVDLLVQRVAADGSTDILYDAPQSGFQATDGGFISFQSIAGTITVEPTPAVAVLFPDELWEITVVADKGGEDFNGYGISIVDDGTITGTDNSAIATYDEANFKVTVAINDGVTTAENVVDAINGVAEFPFTALQSKGAADQPVSIVDPGGDFFATSGSDRGVASVVETVIADGVDAVKASATLLPLDVDFGIKITAKTGGANFNNKTIRLLDDGHGDRLTDGEDAALIEYNDPFLDIYINNGHTSVNTIINAVNSEDIPFTAELIGNGDGTETLHTTPAITVTNTPARVSITPPGANNDLVFTANTIGTALNGVTIRFVDDGTVDGNAAIATYDEGSKTLTILIDSEMTDANAIVSAVENESTFAADLDTNNSGSGVVQSHVTLTSGGDATNKAVAVARLNGSNNDIRFEADDPGAEFNGVTIKFVHDGSIEDGTAVAEYDSPSKTLTITIQNQFTDTLTVIDAVNNGPNSLTIPFTADKSPNEGSEPIQSKISFTGGGSDTNAAFAEVQFPGDGNDLLFEAEDQGAEFNGVKIQFLDDGSINDGTATAEYDSETRTLTINIQDRVTTADDVLQAVNHGLNHESIPFTASYIDDNSGVGGINAFDEGFSSGGVSDTAQAKLSFAGSDNDLVFDAEAAGEQWKDVLIQVIDDGTIDDSPPTSDYDDINKILTINIQNGVTTADDVINAVNSGPNAGTIPFTAGNAPNNDGSGVVHTPAPITAEGADAISASLLLELPGDNNDMTITAETAGGWANGVKVFLIHDDLITLGNAQVNYADTDEQNRTLTIRVKNGVTPTDEVIAAVNDPSILFTAAAAEENGSGVITTATLFDPSGQGPGFITIDASTNLEVRAEITSEAGGLDLEAGNDILFSGDMAQATGTIDPTTGNNNEIDLVAADAGERFNDLSVSYVGNLGAGQAGGEVATYDSGSSTLTVSIENGVTTADQVIAAIDAEGTFDASNSGTSDGFGTVSEEFFSDVTSGGAGQSGALRAVGMIDVLAGGSLANTASTAQTTISTTGQADVILTTGNQNTASSQDLIIDSRGGVSLEGAGLSVDGADLRITAAYDLVTEAPVNAHGPTDTVVLSSKDHVQIKAPITGASIDVDGGTDGDGNVTLGIIGINDDLMSGTDVVVDIRAAGSVFQNENISTVGTSSVTITAASGGITMADGTITGSESGAIRYTAAQDIAVSSIESTTGTIHITAGRAIQDKTASSEDANVRTGGRANFSAVEGIGGFGDADMDTEIAELDAVNSGDAGHIVIQETAAGGDIAALRLTQTHPRGTGHIILTTLDGSITVVEDESGVSVRGAGHILLQAGDDDAVKESDVILQAAVSAQIGHVSVIAADSVEQKSDLTSGATGVHAAGTIRPADGSNNALDLMAVAAGKNFNNLKVAYTDVLLPAQAGNEFAIYDPGTNTLSVAIADGVTTANQVSLAIFLEGTFYATNSADSDGTGSVPAGLFTGVTSGGSGEHASGSITPADGNNNSIDLVSVAAGQNLNDLTVVYAGLLTSEQAGTEVAEYDPGTNTLTVAIADGVTTASQVITAINARGIFYASNSSGDDGTGTISAESFSGVTTGGTGFHAVGAIDNKIELVSVAAGENFNELNVVYSDLLGIQAGQEMALYDADTRTLGVAIENGVTTVNQVVTAINAEGTFYAWNSSGVNENVFVG
ncbi:beta strand repeat-containing protein, partial [Thermodesulfobacteriota bacterium]